MLYSNKKMLSAILLATLLSACGQSATETASSGTTQKAPQTNQTAITPAASSDLLTGLATAYPNGQMPAANAAQAAKELIQNPAVLRLTAASTNSEIRPMGHGPVGPTPDIGSGVSRIQNTTLTGAYFFTNSNTEVETALTNNPAWKLEGTAFFVSTQPNETVNSVYRFRNKINGSYLYTIYESEKADIIANYAGTFVYEGVAWYSRQTSAAGYYPLYRFRNVLNGTYLFTAYEVEKASIQANYSAVFKLEGVAYYVQQFFGFDLVPNAVGGVYDKTECVRDYATGLIWQGQTPAGTGLRANDQYKTNFDSTVTLQKWKGTNTGPGGTLSATLDFVTPAISEVNATTNSIGFKNTVNATNLCGSGEWRLPTLDELRSIVKDSEAPKIDNAWFPNTPAFAAYLTSQGLQDWDGYSWNVNFYYGLAYADLRSSYGVNGFNNLIRLVR